MFALSVIFYSCPLSAFSFWVLIQSLEQCLKSTKLDKVGKQNFVKLVAEFGTDSVILCAKACKVKVLEQMLY